MEWSLNEDMRLAQCAFIHRHQKPEVAYKICGRNIKKSAAACQKRAEEIRQTLRTFPAHAGFRDKCFDIFRCLINDNTNETNLLPDVRPVSIVTTYMVRPTINDNDTFPYLATQEMIEALIATKVRNYQKAESGNVTKMTIDTASHTSNKDKRDDNIVNFTDGTRIPFTDSQVDVTDDSKTNDDSPESIIDILKSNANNTQEFFSIFGEYVKNKFSPKQQKEILIKVCSIATEVELKCLLKNK